MLGSGTVWEDGIGYPNRMMRGKVKLEEDRRKALVSQRAVQARQDGTSGGESGQASLVDLSGPGASPNGNDDV